MALGELESFGRAAMSPLITSSAELALDLLEKDGVLVPFCKLTDSAGGTIYIQPDAAADADDESMLLELQKRLDAEQVKEFALCADVQVKFKGIPDEQRCLRIEFQDGSEETGIYYFPLALQNGRASLGSCHIADVPQRRL